MKLSFWVAFISLITSISSYALPGAYERLWFYYAYTLDTAGTKVAPSCARPPKRCTFQEFLRYIDQNPQSLRDLPANINPFDTDNAALKLDAEGYSGAYRPGLIYKDASSGTRGVFGLFRLLGGYLSGHIDSAPEETKNALRTAITAVAVLRKSASLPDFKKWVKEQENKDLYLRQENWGNGQTREVIDYDETSRRNNDWTRDKVDESIERWCLREPGHSENIKAASEVRAMISKPCRRV